MPTSSKTKNSKIKWTDAQFVLDDDGLPLPRGTRAVEILSVEQAGHKRGRSTEPFLGGPEFCGPVEDLSGVAFTASDESRGGPAALRHWREARRQVDWVAVGEQLSGPQCEQCLKGGHMSCDEHRIEPPEAPRRWWHGSNRDQGLEEISERAAAKEAMQQVSSRGLAGLWRREWPALRHEQLRLQGQGHLATDERMAPGRPDSIEWMVQGYQTQIGFMVRDGWESWKAEAYTLLACCATAALGRAAREGGTDYPHSARLLRDVLDERRSVCCGTTYQPVPLAYTNLTGPLSLTSSDPVWAQLCVRGGPLPEVGLELLTSALAVAVASAECFQSAQGFAATLSRGGVAEVLAVESDVVCFESRGPAVAGGPHRSLVSVGGDGYHLPPGARLRLHSVQQRFKAYGTSVRRRLFTVTVEGFGAAPAATTAVGKPRGEQAAGSSSALAPPALAPSLGRPLAATSLLAAAPEPAEDALSTDGAASGSGFAESGEEDGDGSSDDGGGTCARVPAAPGGAAKALTMPCDGGGARP